MEENNNNYDKFTEDEKIEEKDVQKQLVIIRSIMYPFIILTVLIIFAAIIETNAGITAEGILTAIVITCPFIFLEILLLWGLTKEAKAKLKEAQHNDQVRKDARIWYKEFKRLELEDKKNIIKKPPQKKE